MSFETHVITRQRAEVTGNESVLHSARHFISAVVIIASPEFQLAFSAFSKLAEISKDWSVRYRSFKLPYSRVFGENFSCDMLSWSSRFTLDFFRLTELIQTFGTFARQGKLIFSDWRSCVYCKANSFLYLQSNKPVMFGGNVIATRQLKKRSTEIRQLSVSFHFWLELNNQ